MTHKGTGNPALTYATEGLNYHSSWAILYVLSDVVLYGGRARKIQMFPSKEQEVPEVLQPWVYSGT